MSSRVLVVDDLASARSLYRRFLEAAGHEVTLADGVKAALPAVERGGADIVLTDLRMPELDGIDGLRAMRVLDAELPVIVITAFATVESAVEAMRLGAVDYLRKPCDPEQVLRLIDRALERKALRRENTTLRSRLAGRARAELVAESPAMREAILLAERVAGTDVTVLIEGETGTGKECVSHLIHTLSARSAGKFVSLNCSAIPEPLFESELFGHAAGAFSGATSTTRGFVGQAQNGTLFLDEIGDLPLQLQPKLLRLLQSGEYYPVGDQRLARSNARVVCATNSPLAALMRQGSFRADLYYRVQVMTITLPPLRERREDIEPLARRFLDIYARKFGLPAMLLDGDVLELFRSYPWPGNVRQLENVIERSVLVAGDTKVGVQDLPVELLGGQAAPEAAPLEDYESARDAFERRYLSHLLDSAGGSIARAARLAGLHRATLYKWLTRRGMHKGTGG